MKVFRLKSSMISSNVGKTISIIEIKYIIKIFRLTNTPEEKTLYAMHASRLHTRIYKPFAVATIVDIPSAYSYKSRRKMEMLRSPLRHMRVFQHKRIAFRVHTAFI